MVKGFHSKLKFYGSGYIMCCAHDNISYEARSGADLDWNSRGGTTEKGVWGEVPPEFFSKIGSCKQSSVRILGGAMPPGHPLALDPPLGKI